jgi:hypothetical protein
VVADNAVAIAGGLAVDAAVVGEGVGNDAWTHEQRCCDEKGSLSVAEMRSYCAAPEASLMTDAALIKQAIVVDGRMIVPVEMAIVV